MVGPLEEKLNEEAQTDPLRGRSPRWRQLRTGHHRSSERDELPIGANLHWSHFTKDGGAQLATRRCSPSATTQGGLGGKLPSRSYSFWRLFPLRCITTCFSLPRRGSLHRQGFPGSAEKLKLIWAQCRSAAIFAVTKNRFRQVLRRIVSGVAVCDILSGNAHIATAKPTECSATTSLLQYN